MGRATAFTGVLLWCVELAALCLPALVGRNPLMFSDTRSYYLGGRAAVVKVSALFWSLLGPAGARPDDIASTETAIQNARAVRSIPYSLFTYGATHAVSLWLVIAVQAALTGFVLRMVFDMVRPGEPRWRFTILVMLLSLATSLSWTVSFIMPDIFTPILALCLMLLVVYWDRMSAGKRWTVLTIVAVSVEMHLTNLPIALGVLLVSAAIRVRWLWRDRVPYCLAGGALALGAVAMLAIGVIGFKQWTLAPQSPPFLLARSLDDGPGKLYLREHCPQLRSVMCQHLDRLDVGVDDFIWHANGVYAAVSPEEAARIRAEDKRIFVAAALEHPWMQMTAIARNTLTQLALFTLRDFRVPVSADYSATEMTLGWDETFPPWKIALSALNYAAVLAGLGYVLREWLNGRLGSRQKHFFSLILATVVINAATGAFSMPAPRYEARVIWLVPMAALLFADRLGVRRQA